MNITIRKWGNSNGLRIPKSVMDAMGLQTNDQVEMRLEGNSLIIKRAGRRHKSYEERMTEFYGVPIEQIERTQQEEVCWGSPAGDELQD